MSQRYANILKDLVEDQEDTIITAQTFNINNKFIIREEFCDFESDVSLSNYNIKDVGSISPCTEINVGNLTLQGNTISNSTGVNMLLNNVQKINNKLLPNGDFFGTSDQLSITQISNGLITNSKIATGSVSLDKIATISTGTILGNKELSNTSPAALSISQVKTMLNLSNTNTGDQTIILSGAISGTGSSTISTTLADNAVTNAKIFVKAVSLDKIINIGPNTILGNNISGNQSPSALSISDVKTMLNLAGNNTGDQTIILNGAVSGSGSSTITTTLADNSVSLGKMATLTPLSIIGNNLGTSATPDALSIAEVKAMLDLSGVNSGDQNITISGDVIGSGSTEIITTINNGRITLAKMATLAANSIIGNNTGSAITPKALTTGDTRTLLSLNNVENVALSTWAGSSSITTVGTINTLRLSNITSPGTITITPNAGASPLEIWGPLDMKTNNISNVNIFTSSGSMSNGGTYSNFVTSRSTNSNLTLNANGTGIVVTNNSSFWVSSTVTNLDSMVAINGPTVGNSRFVGCYQNGTYKLSFGLSASTHFFIYDGVNARDLFQASILNANIRFPTYTTNGTLSFTGGNGTISSSSDRRLKMEEELLNNGESLEKIMNLQPKKFKWISTPDVQEIGFIAQDVELSIPEAVDGKKFEYEFIRDNASQGNEGIVRLDEEGKPVLDYEKPRYRGLNQCAILSTLVSAFQESIQKINLLEMRIAELENH